MKETYCHYCCRFKNGTGFKLKIDPVFKTPRRMCPTCQSVRKLPASRLTELAEKERQERKSR